MTFQNSHVRFYVSLIWSGEGRHTIHLLKCVLLLSSSQTDWKQSSDIFSDISFDILSDIFFWQSFWQSFWHSSFWHNSRLRSGAEHWPHRIAVEVRRGTLNSKDRGWGPARHTGLTGSRLRSGAEHWTLEVRRGTLNSQDRGWGPVRNTDHTSSQDETKAEAEEKEEVKADIKSNNPHLTGGESPTNTHDWYTWRDQFNAFSFFLKQVGNLGFDGASPSLPIEVFSWKTFTRYEIGLQILRRTRCFNFCYSASEIDYTTHHPSIISYYNYT